MSNNQQNSQLPPELPEYTEPDAPLGEDDEIVDAAEDNSSGKLQQSFKCKNCGAKLEFKPGTDSQSCPYCGHNNPIPRSEEDIQELDLEKYLASTADSEDQQEVLTITCDQCAAEISTPPNVTAQQCPYCGSNIVAMAKSSRQIKPRSLLPFKVPREKARQLFHQWIKKLWFAPNDLKKVVKQDDRFNGIYVPYWTYDSDTISFYRGLRGIYYYVSHTYRDSKGNTHTRRVRKTRWYPVSGTVWHSFDDVLVLASTSLPQKYTQKLEPWDLENLTGYKDEYLSGFRAESYQVTLLAGFSQASEIMDSHIRTLIRRDIGGDTQRIISVNTQHDNVTFKHILLPVWISAYRYKAKVYRLLVNARTGEVQGERPWSWIKITLAALAAAAVIGLIAWLIIQHNGGSGNWEVSY